LESRNKISLAKKSKNHPQYGLKGKNSHDFRKTHSIESWKKISKALLSKKHSEETHAKISAAKIGIIIHLYSLNPQLLNTFISFRIAVQYLYSNKNTILKYARSGKIFKD